MQFAWAASFFRWCYAFGAIVQLIARPVAQRVVEVVLFDWVPAGAMHTFSGHLVNFNAQWGMLLDPLSCVMLFVVTGVGFPDSRVFHRVTWRTRAATTAFSAI